MKKILLLFVMLICAVRLFADDKNVLNFVPPIPLEHDEAFIGSWKMQGIFGIMGDMTTHMLGHSLIVFQNDGRGSETNGETTDLFVWATDKGTVNIGYEKRSESYD